MCANFLRVCHSGSLINRSKPDSLCSYVSYRAEQSADAIHSTYIMFSTFNVDPSHDIVSANNM